MTTNVGEEPGLKSAVSKLDDDGSNPFWPKGAGGPGQPDAPASNKITFGNITFGADPADVTVNVTTTPAGEAWTVNWGDGGAAVPIAAGTNTATHHYADKSPGKQYTVAVSNPPDTDTKNVVY
jgi:hypothetical protein